MLEWCGSLEGFQVAIHPGDYLGGIHSARNVWVFHRTVKVWCGEPKPTNSWFGYHAYQRLHSIRFACEPDGKIYFIYIFLICCYLSIYLIDNIFILQATTLGREPSLIELFYGNACAKWWPLKKMRQFIDNRTQHFMVRLFSTIFLLSYYFLEFYDFIFYFQETYNNCLKERYREDPSTHPDFNPDLWLEAGSSGGPDRNWVYGLSNTMAENLWTTHSVSIVKCSQLVPSTESPKFTVLLD
jgi:hypothetical protein